MFEFLKNLGKVADGQILDPVAPPKVVDSIEKRLDSVFKDAWAKDQKELSKLNKVKDDFKDQFPDMKPSDMAKALKWLEKKLPKDKVS